ncbi:MAG: hypothetical protein KY475_18085 [Planctomycetes bacterium]|nr:hypothetical protein [Planctomycetota bacterium]
MDPVEVEINLPDEHLYTSGAHPYFRAPHIYIATPTRFMPRRGSTTDVVLATSRDGVRFDRTIKDAFIRPGLDPKNWGNRANYTAYQIVPTSLREMSIYMQGGRRYALRTDGFVSVNAPYEGGEMTTRPLIFAGSRLVVNFSTSAAGQIRVELQDASGRPLAGYALDDAKPLIGDRIEQEVSWAGGADVSQLAGQAVRLRFVMEDADLYSLRFR